MLEHLREQGEKQIAELWEQARLTLENEQKSMSQSLVRKIEEAKWESQRRAEQHVQVSLLEARRLAGADRAKAFQAFAERLWRQSLISLPELKKNAGKELLSNLLAELPQLEWTKVILHPSDRQQAEDIFPNVPVEEDEAIEGGFILEAEQGCIRFVNTLNKRLEMTWQELVSDMVAKIKDVNNENAAAD